jgi:hypothetical protein
MLRFNPYANHKFFRGAIICLSALLLGHLLTGCVSIKVQANKDEASVKQIKRLFVLIQHGDIGKQSYPDELAAAMRSAFTNTPVVTEISIANPLELDESVHRQQIDAFGGDAVLLIRATGGIVNQSGGYQKLLYDASLFDPQLKKRVWRARVDNSGGTWLMKRRFREMSESIVRQLKSDGFI